MSLAKILSRVGLLFCISGLLLSQQTESTKTADAPSEQTPATTIRANVKVVNMLATVRDKHGKIISNLSKDDFTLEEDGHPVAIQYFSKETDLPLTLGLLVDTSLSQRRVLDQEQAASKAFIDQVLREKDTAFVLHFDREVELLQDLTSSRPKLENALESLHTSAPRDDNSSSGSGGSGAGGNPTGQGQGPGQRRGRGMHSGGGTLLYDAIYLASDELMKKQTGRKAVIVLSDGVDRGSTESLETAIATAQRADTLVYSILFKDEEESGDHGGFGFPGGGSRGGGGMGGGGMGGGRRGGGQGQGQGQRYPREERPDGKKILQRISKETGGRFFEVSKKQPIDQIYSSIQEELRNQYSLGFPPDKADNVGYHKIMLKTKQKDTEVQTRDGFYLQQ